MGNRLTRKDHEFKYYVPNFDKNDKWGIILKLATKLGQLEDFEDEFEIDLDVFLTMFIKEDIYLKDKDGYVCCCDYEVTYNKDEKGWYFVSCLLGKYYLKDYGKTWALTEEELEHAK